MAKKRITPTYREASFEELAKEEYANHIKCGYAKTYVEFLSWYCKDMFEVCLPFGWGWV